MIDRKKISDEINRATAIQAQCESKGNQTGIVGCIGYLRALRWVEAQGVPDVNEDDYCHHGIADGDWCPECNAEYKAARMDPENHVHTEPEIRS